jgi:biotin/methionine sulfoxide reductase
MPAALVAPCRVRRPAIRRSVWERGEGASPERRGVDPFVEVSWGDALRFVAAELERVRTECGNAAIFAGSYGWASAGRFHHAQSQVHRFMNAFGGYVSHVTSYSLGAGRTLLPHIVMPIDEVRKRQTASVVLEEHCTMLVAFGGLPAKNLQVNAGGASQHEARSALERLVRRGARCVIIGPSRRDVAGDGPVDWISIRPGTDTAVMLALAHTLIGEELHDRAFLSRCTTGFEDFRRYVMGEVDGVAKSCEWAGPIADVSPERLRDLARQMAASRTMINASWSLQRAEHGEQPFWMTVTLAALLGQIGLPGGGFGFGYGAVNAEGAWASAFSGPVLSQGRNGVREFIPVARVADMLLHPGAPFEYDGKTYRYPDIRLVYWCGGNPFHHHQDLNRLVRAWQRPQTIVVHEQFWTATAKHADVVLPATTSLERDDIGSASRDRFLIAMKKAAEPPGEAKDDYAIFGELADALGIAPAYTEGRSVRQWLEFLYDDARRRAEREAIVLPEFDAFWAAGYHEMARPRVPQVLMDDFRADPDAHPLPTPSGKIEIHSEEIAGFGYVDCPGHPVWIPPNEWLGGELARRFPLHLLSNQPDNKLHSQYDHAALSRANKIVGREPILMHPDDADARGLRAGDVVKVFNARGSCLAGVRIDAGLRRSVVLMATGAWYDPEVKGQPGALDKHGNPNVLCADVGSSLLSQGCTAQSCLVEVVRFEGTPPAITAFDPPEFVH